MVRWFPVLLALVSGCAHRTVRVDVAPTPAVSLPASRVAVVAQDRACRPVADALIAALRERAAFEVDPRADLRLLVFGCGLDVGYVLREEVDATGPRSESIRKLDLTGRGRAVLAVTEGQETLAHLVGSGRDGHQGGWGAVAPFQTRNALLRSLTEAVAADLATQLSPLPQQLARRVYPNATPGSARGLHTLAVRAELRGDLDAATRFAREAAARRPSDRARAYLASLEQQPATVEPAQIQPARIQPAPRQPALTPSATP